MLTVELVGIFTRPFALMMRLFANISAGHFMVLGLISLIFVFSKGTSLGAGLGIAPLSIFFSLFILTLELLVAIVQAYVFTLLTCVFLGGALEEHHHEEAHH
jgi:F-type H+-transporting ATPase subunit a